MNQCFTYSASSRHTHTSPEGNAPNTAIAWASLTKYHRLGGLKNRHLFISHSSEVRDEGAGMIGPGGQMVALLLYLMWGLVEGQEAAGKREGNRSREPSDFFL